MTNYRGFDAALAQHKAEQAESLQARELRELEEGTEAANRGMSNPLNWLFLIGGLLAAPFTGGVSLLVSIAAGIAMSGGPAHMAEAAMPMSVDVVAPQAGCMRVVAALATLILVIVAVAFVLALVAFETGAIGK